MGRSRSGGARWERRPRRASTVRGDRAASLLRPRCCAPESIPSFLTTTSQLLPYRLRRSRVAAPEHCTSEDRDGASRSLSALHLVDGGPLVANVATMGGIWSTYTATLCTGLRCSPRRQAARVPAERLCQHSYNLVVAG